MASVIIPIVGVNASVLAGVLGGLGDVARKIVISINNHSGIEFENPGLYFESGTSDLILYNIPSNNALVWGARKTAGPVATGSVGVITYNIKDRNCTLAVMWSVPFDYNLYSNWWGVNVYDGYRGASKEIFNEMYANMAQKGDNIQKSGSLNAGWSYKDSAMAQSGTPDLQIHVYGPN